MAISKMKTENLSSEKATNLYQQNHSFAAKTISQNNGHIQILRQQNQTVVHLVLTRSAEEKKTTTKKTAAAEHRAITRAGWIKS